MILSKPHETRNFYFYSKKRILEEQILQLKRKIFEYGIFAMAVACTLAFGLLMLDLLSFVIDKIVN